MTTEIDWDDVQGNQGQNRTSGGSSGRFLKLQANATHYIRPVGKPVMFYKLMNRHDGQFKSAIISDPDKSSIPQKYPEMKPQRRFGMIIFDRDDDDKMKILEFGAKVFEALKYYKNMTNDEPGGKDGGVFEIQVKCPTGKKDKNTDYEVKLYQKEGFNETEKEQLKEWKEALKSGESNFDLKKIFAAVGDDDEAERRLFGDDDNQNNQNNQPAESKVSDDTVAAVGNDDDDDPLDW